MGKKSIERIEYFEPILVEGRKTAESFSKELEQFKKQCERIKELSAYYCSDDWFEDFESHENGDIDRNINCGVLSEDEIFDLLENCRETAIEMLDTASYILKNI